MNFINVIQLYWHSGMWGFDDPPVGTLGSVSGSAASHGPRDSTTPVIPESPSMVFTHDHCGVARKTRGSRIEMRLTVQDGRMDRETAMTAESDDGGNAIALAPSVPAFRDGLELEAS